MSRGHQIGLDIGRGRVKVAQRDGHGRIIRLASMRRRDGQGVIGADAESIAEALERKGFERHPVVVGACMTEARIDEIELPVLAASAPVERLVRGEVARLARWKSDEYVASWWAIPPAMRTPPTSAMLVVSCPNSVSEAWAEPLARAGLDVVAVDVRQGAIVRACSMKAQATGLMLVADIGWGSTELSAWMCGELVFVRSLEGRGLESASALLADVACDRLMAFERLVLESEKPVNACTARWVRRVEGSVGNLGLEISREIEKTLVYLTRRFGGSDVARTWVAGGGAGVGRMMRVIEDRLGAIGICKPWELMEVVGQAATHGADPMFVTACGLAQWGGENT